MRPVRSAGQGGARRGTVIIVALVLLVLISALLPAMVQVSLASRRRLVLAERTAQAGWLAASGLDRAAARLRDDPAYDGETWAIPADVFDGRLEAVVSITVEPVDDAPGMHQAIARAELRIGPDRVVTSTQSALVSEAGRAGDEDEDKVDADITDTETNAGPETAPEEDR